MNQIPDDKGRTISDPEHEMVDPTHPYGPGGAKKDDVEASRQDDTEDPEEQGTMGGS